MYLLKKSAFYLLLLTIQASLIGSAQIKQERQFIQIKQKSNKILKADQNSVNHIVNDANPNEDNAKKTVDAPNKPIFVRKNRPKLKVLEEGRVLIVGTNNNRVKLKIRKNFENWIVEAASPLKDGTKIKLLENGMIFVSSKNSLWKASLKEKIKNLLLDYKDVINSCDPSIEIPAIHPKLSVKITEEGKIWIRGTPNHSVKGRIEKQIEEFLRKSNLTGSSRVLYKIQQCGTILIIGVSNSIERMRDEQLVKNWLLQNRYLFKNYDLENPPRAKEQLSVEIKDCGSINIKTNDWLLRYKVKAQIIHWILKSLPPLQGLKIDIDVEGRIIVTGTSDNDLIETIVNAIKELVLTNRKLFQNYNINKPLQFVAGYLTVTVTKDWRIVIDTSKYLKQAVIRTIETWLLTGFQGLAGNLKLTILDDGSVIVGGNISETVRIHIIQRIKFILKDNKDELENFHLQTKLPHLVGNANVHVQSDGRILIDGPEYINIDVKRQIEAWLLTGFSNFDHDQKITFKFLDDGTIDINDTVDELLLAQLKKYIKEIILTNAHILEVFDPLFGLPPIQWNVEVSITDDGKIFINSPAYLRDIIKHFIEKWLLLFFPTITARFTISIQVDGSIVINGSLEPEQKNIIKWIIKDILLDNKTLFAKYDISKPLPSLHPNWQPSVHITQDGKVQLDGSDSLKYTTKHQIEEWLPKFLPKYNGNFTVKILSDGELQINGALDAATKLALKAYYISLLLGNVNVFASYDLFKPLAVFNWTVAVTIDTRVLIQGPEDSRAKAKTTGTLIFDGPASLVEKAKQELIQWVLIAFPTVDTGIKFIILENGSIEVTGTTDVILKKRLEQLIIDYLLYGKEYLKEYDIVKGYPTHSSKINVIVRKDGTLKIEGPTPFVNRCREDLAKWLRSHYPTLNQTITFTILESGEISITGTSDVDLLLRLEQLNKDVLLNSKNILLNFDIVKGFPIVDTPVTIYDLTTSLPKIETNLTITIDENYGIFFDGPGQAEAAAKIESWIEKCFPSLTGDLTVHIETDGQISINTTLKDSIKALVIQRIKLLIKTYKSEIIHSQIVPLPFNIWEVTVIVKADEFLEIDGPEVLKGKIKQQITDALIKAIPSLEGNVEIQIEDNGQVLIEGTTDKALLASVRNEIHQILVDNKYLLINLVLA